jgi:putative transcriptional regulator
MLSVIDLLLMDYAAGSLCSSHTFVIASHLALKPEARKKVSSYESLGGRTLEDIDPKAVTQNCLDAVLARIESPACRETAAERKKLSNDDIPECILSLIADYCAEETLTWRRLMKGVDIIDLHLCKDVPRTKRRVSLLKVAPYASTPRHHHDGLEVTVVLKGSYHDEFGRYLPGDMALMQADGVSHHPVAEESGCVCLLVSDGLGRPVNPFLRFFSRLQGA